MSNTQTQLARYLAGAPDVPRPYEAPLNPIFHRGVVCAYNADGSLSCTVDGSLSAFNCDALNGMAPAIGACVELHSFGTRYVVDGVINTSPQMALKVAQSGALTGSSGVHKMTFDTVGVDDSNGWASSRFTIQSPGRYEYHARLSAAAGVGRMYVSLFKNGSEGFRGGDVSSSSVIGVEVSGFTDCVAGDYLELFYFQSTGAAFEAGTSLCWFRLRKV